MAAYGLAVAAPQSTLGDSTIGMLQFNALENPVVVLIRIAPGMAVCRPSPIDDWA